MLLGNHWAARACGKTSSQIALASLPRAVICCGSHSTEVGTEAPNTPLWVSKGDADTTVPVSLSRDRIAARRKTGGHPTYTEYAGVDHNCWEWAF